MLRAAVTNEGWPGLGAPKLPLRLSVASYITMPKTGKQRTFRAQIGKERGMQSPGSSPF